MEGTPTKHPPQKTVLVSGCFFDFACRTGGDIEFQLPLQLGMAGLGVNTNTRGLVFGVSTTHMSTSFLAHDDRPHEQICFMHVQNFPGQRVRRHNCRIELSEVLAPWVIRRVPFLKRIAFAGMVLTMTGCAALPGLVVRTAPETTRSDGSLAKFQEAETLYARMQWAEAQTAYVALTDEFPRNAFLWFRLGNCQTRLDKLEPAAQAYQNALSIEPQEGRYSYNLGLVRLAQARLAFDHAQHRLAGHEQIRRDAVEQAQRVEAALAPTPAGRP